MMMQRIYDMSPGNMYKQKLKSKKDVNMHIQPGKVNISRFNKNGQTQGGTTVCFFCVKQWSFAFNIYRPTEKFSATVNTCKLTT